MNDAIDLTPANLGKGVQNGGRPGPSSLDQEEHNGMSMPEARPSPEEVQDAGIKSNNEPGPGGALAKVLSRTISRISNDPGPPPDGGLVAWTQGALFSEFTSLFLDEPRV